MFSLVHQCLVLCYDQGSAPQSWLTSETFCIFKGKGSWQDPDRWRPIAMSNCIYRLLMRWCYKKLYPLLSPLLHSCQFGRRQEISTSHATQTFLKEINTDTPWESIFALDMYHTFDSPPKILIREVLERMGTPAKLLRIITTVLEHGSTFIRGSPNEIFRTTHGVKQGCPLSCFLFVLVFEIPLQYMQSKGLVFRAYVDDVSTPLLPSEGPRTAEMVQRALNLIRCQLNVVKSEALPLCNPQPLSPSLPKYRHPPAPLQASTEFWLLISWPSLPEWADTSEQPLKQVSYLLHLGHPLPAHFDLRRGFWIIADELLGQLADLNSQPIQTLNRVLLANTVIIHRVLYRSECFPVDSVQLCELSNAIERFVLGVAGIPSPVAKKTLYTHRSHGLGVRSLAVLQPTRVLDSLHRNPQLSSLRTHRKRPMSPYSMYTRALELLGPPTTSTMLPLPVTWKAGHLLRNAVEVTSVAGLTAYIFPGTGTQPDCTYTDGSRLVSPPASGASAVLHDGRIVMCQVPGSPNPYKAEVIGLLLGSHFSPPHTPLRVDCKVAIASTTGTRRPIRHARGVIKARESLLCKNQPVEWIEGHTAHVHQECSDEHAKYGAEEVWGRQPPSFPWHAKPQSHKIQDFLFSFLLIFHQFGFLQRVL